MKRITLLGASGSIGTQTLKIIKDNPNDFELCGVSVGHRINILKEIINSFPSIKYACVEEESDKNKLIFLYPNIKFYCKDEGILELIKASFPDLVVNALVGFVGFLPSVYTIKSDIDLALANKESLVVGGKIINDLLKNHKSKLYPIDSEHVALAKCLENKSSNEVKRLVITASGGSFRDLTHEQLKDVTVEQALHHPSWNMGGKITIDSATMMNKGFEVIEAMYLFNVPVEKISILLHDESIIHSLVEFTDNSYLADIGPTTMCVPISYALYGEKRKPVEVKPLDLETISALHFRKFDVKRYPCVSYALRAIKEGGSMPCALNASNEEAVYAFLRNEISFLDIEEIIKSIMDSHRVIDNPTIEDLVYVDKLVRKLTLEEIKRRKNK